MKVITPMEWRIVVDVLEYIKQHIDEGQCQDCFSYDMEQNVDEALEIMHALADKTCEDVDDILMAEIQAEQIESAQEIINEMRAEYQEYEQE